MSPLAGVLMSLCVLQLGLVLLAGLVTADAEDFVCGVADLHVDGTDHIKPFTCDNVADNLAGPPQVQSPNQNITADKFPWIGILASSTSNQKSCLGVIVSQDLVIASKPCETNSSYTFEISHLNFKSDLSEVPPKPDVNSENEMLVFKLVTNLPSHIYRPACVPDQHFVAKAVKATDSCQEKTNTLLKVSLKDGNIISSYSSILTDTECAHNILDNENSDCWRHFDQSQYNCMTIDQTTQIQKKHTYKNYEDYTCHRGILQAAEKCDLDGIIGEAKCVGVDENTCIGFLPSNDKKELHECRKEVSKYTKCITDQFYEITKDYSDYPFQGVNCLHSYLPKRPECAKNKKKQGFYSLGSRRGYNPIKAYRNEIKKCNKVKDWNDKQNCKKKIEEKYKNRNYKPYQGKWSISMLKEVKEVNTCIVNATGCNVCGNSGGSVCIDQQVDSGETEFAFWYESCRDRWFFLGPSTTQQRKKICSQTQMTEMSFLEENTRLIQEYARDHSETNITILPLYPKPVIVMLGNTGVGKSTLANGLLMGHAGNKQCFKTSSGASSQTKLTKWSTGKWLGVGHCVTVIDTPGTQDTGGKQRDYENVINIMNLLKDEIGQIDVFLVLFNGKQPRFGQGIKAALNTYEAIFGHTFWDHVVTEFTFWKFVKSDIRDRYVENCRELKNDCLNDSELCADDVCEWDSSDDGDSSGDGDYSGEGNNSGDNSGDGDYYEGRRKRSVNNQNPVCKLMMEDEGSFSSNTSPENIINSNGSAVNEDFWDAQCGWRSLPQETDYPAGWDEGSKAIYNKADLIGRYVKAESWKRQYEEKMFVSKQIPSVFINPLWSNNTLGCERFQRETNKLWNTIESFDPYSCTDKCEAPESYFVGKPHIFGEDTIYIENSETTPGSPLHCSVWNGVEGAAISMDVEWYHSSNKPLNLSSVLYSMNILGGGGMKKQQTLQLNINTANITLQDLGLYYCFLENHTLSSKPSIELGSLVTPDMIQRGGSITASCEIFDLTEEQMKEKLPYVKWYFAKKIQDAGSNYNMTLDSEAKHDQFSIQKLIFERMDEDYEGNYTCKVGGQFSDEVKVNMNVDASWSEWGSETPCSVTCGNGGHKTRTRSCNMQRNKGLSCDTLKETALKDGNHADTKQTSCEYKCCPVNGLWSKWQSWSSCSQKCFNTTSPHAQQGQKNRQRTCNNPSKQCNGKDCIGSSIENSSCNTFNCKIHGEWSTWSNWSKCTRDLNVACSGTEERTRQCTNPAPQYGGMKCSDSGIQTLNCDPVCAVNCKETSWLNWSQCSKTCQHYKRSEHGTSTRKRGSIPPVNGGKTCEQLGIPLQESKSCIINQNCPRDGFWGAWSNYGKCDHGTGEKRRERSCYFEDTLNSPANMQEIFDQTKSFGGHDCPGIPEEVTKCSVDCRCTAPWSRWETCTAKCKGPADKLIQRRRRSCIPAKNNGRECTDDDTTQEEDCKVPRCPYEIDGVWSEWGAFSECPYECGGSFQTKKRTCNHPNKDLLDYDPKKDILKDCAGSSIAVHEEMCNKQACSIKSLTFVMDTSGSFDGTDQDTAQQLASALMNELERENIAVPRYQVISSPGQTDDYWNPGSFLRYDKPQQVLPETPLTATFINQYTNLLTRNQYGTQCNLDALYFTLEHHAKNGAVIVLYTDDGTYESDREDVAEKIIEKVTDKQATIVIFITPYYIGDDESMMLYRNIAENRVYVMSEVQNTAKNVIGIVKRNLQKKGDGNRCIAAGGPLWPIEQYECQFPFKYEGVKYFDCIKEDHVQPWCSTYVDVDLNHLDGNVGLCGDCSGVIHPACSGYTVLKVSNIKDQERGCKADEIITSSCKCGSSSCAVGTVCAAGTTCTPVCQADVLSETDCLCGDSNCGAGSTCVGGSTCTAGCKADEIITSECMCGSSSYIVGSVCTPDWGEWGSWSEMETCTRRCGGGKQRFKTSRSCNPPTMCKEVSRKIEERDCNTRACKCTNKGTVADFCSNLPPKIGSEERRRFCNFDIEEKREALLCDQVSPAIADELLNTYLEVQRRDCNYDPIDVLDGDCGQLLQDKLSKLCIDETCKANQTEVQHQIDEAIEKTDRLYEEKTEEAEIMVYMKKGQKALLEVANNYKEYKNKQKELMENVENKLKDNDKLSQDAKNELKSKARHTFQKNVVKAKTILMVTSELTSMKQKAGKLKKAGTAIKNQLSKAKKHLKVISKTNTFQKLKAAFGHVLSSVKKFQKGDTMSVMRGILKVASGISQFLPPPYSSITSTVSSIFNKFLAGPSTEDVIKNEFKKQKEWMEGKFDAIDKRFDALSSDIKQKFGNIESKLNNLKESIADQTEEIKSFLLQKAVSDQARKAMGLWDELEKKLKFIIDNEDITHSEHTLGIILTMMVDFGKDAKKFEFRDFVKNECIGKSDQDMREFCQVLAFATLMMDRTSELVITKIMAMVGKSSLNTLDFTGVLQTRKDEAYTFLNLIFTSTKKEEFSYISCGLSDRSNAKLTAEQKTNLFDYATHLDPSLGLKRKMEQRQSCVDAHYTEPWLPVDGDDRYLQNEIRDCCEKGKKTQKKTCWPPENGGVDACAHPALSTDSVRCEGYFKLDCPAGCMTTPSRPDINGNPSKGNTKCIFPFTFSGKTYYKCAPGSVADHLSSDSLWCSTKIDENGEHVSGQGEWGYCACSDFGFERCVNSWCLQHGTNQQYIRCRETRDGGDTCVEPEIKYGQTEGGIPHVHSDNDYDTWCEQIFQREKMGSITRGPRDCSAPKGKLLWCSSFDQSRPKWCDWSDGHWRSSSLDYHSGCSSAITSLTCRATLSGYYRFESPAGIKMPESGNDVRGNEAWIQGGHPKVNDKVQRRRICFGPLCEHAKQIRVITCPSNRGESFHLYELEKPPQGYKYVAQEGTCPTDWVTIRTNCFFVSSDKLSWADAMNSCKSKGGELFEPQNVNTNEKVWKYVKLAEKLDVHTHYWVGFNDMVKEGDWLSAITGDFNALSEFPWSPNSPHNNNTLNCINVITKSGKWTDSSCSTSRHYICQQDQNV